MLMTHANLLAGVNKLGLFQALFRLFRRVPSAWNKVFLYGQRVCGLFSLFVPLFHTYI